MMMTTIEQVQILNEFGKQGDYATYRKSFHKLSKEERERAIENLAAGDDVKTALANAKQYVRANQ